MNQYSLTKHSILPLIYRVLHQQEKQITYLIKQPQTKSLIMFGNDTAKIQKFFKANQKNLHEIQHQTQCKLKYIMVNDYNKNDNTYVKTSRNQQILSPKSQGDLKPLVLGQLTMCFISASGFTPTYSLIALTHLSATSTKLPILFPGSLLSPCSISYKDMNIKAKDYINSLQKIKYFPNETYIFPSKTVSFQDLMFAKALNDNQFINQKIKIFNNNKQYLDALIPTTVMEEKVMNPFMNSDRFKDLLGTNDNVKAFNLLRKMRQQFQL